MHAIITQLEDRKQAICLGIAKLGIGFLLALLSIFAIASIPRFAFADNGPTMVDAFVLDVTQDYERAYQVLDIVNKERADRGLNPLAMDKELLATAMTRAMEISYFYSHTRPDGTRCYTAFPMGSTLRAENIAWGVGSSEEVMSGWMNSEGHRSNILNPNLASIGVGCVKMEGSIAWAQCFDDRVTCEQPIPDNKTFTTRASVPANWLVEDNFFMRGLRIPTYMSESYQFGVSFSRSTLFGNDYCSLNPTMFAWSSSDPKVATVDQYGNMMAISPGTTEIRATLGNYFTLSETLVVEKVNIGVTDVEIPKVVAYEGAPCTPKPIISLNGNLLQEGKDYTLFYEHNDYPYDHGLITIQGIGNYFDSQTWGFDIEYLDNGGSSYEEPDISSDNSDRWIHDSKGWWYREIDGAYPENCWAFIDGDWYHFDSAGYMQTGWLRQGGIWYYLKPSGAMTVGWIKVKGIWYYLNASGAMQVGWLKIGNSWYYLTENGAMTTGWNEVGGLWYYFDDSGAMQANKWIGNYYVTGSGAMATNTTINGYKVGADGKWIP